MKKTLIILILLAAAGYGGWRWFKARQAKAADAAPSTQTLLVERGDLSQTIKATGVVQPQNRLVIRPPVSGRIDDVLVREGQYVKKGQTLVLMSSDERAALLDAARARGPEELARWEALYKPAPLLAPLSGMVIARSVEPGQSASQADTVLVLADRLIVKGQVDETDIARVRLGQDCLITLDAYADQPVKGRVDHIAFEAKTVSNVTIYEVEVLPLKVPAFMRSGMTANVDFVVESREDVLLLPADALQPQADGSALVQVPNPKDPSKPRLVPVRTGLSDGKRVELLEGLDEGDAVLVQGLPKIQGGLKSPFMMRPPGAPRGTRGGGGGAHPH
jgi:macrolide-specific efflux system membrane fusion protein